MKNLLFTLLFTILVRLLFAGAFTGDPKTWTKNDFLGFDEVGDCIGKTGDISSVFAKVVNGNLMLRVTFDDMVTRQDNKVVSDNFTRKDIVLTAVLQSGSGNKTAYAIQTASLEKSVKAWQYKRTTESNMLEILFNYKISQMELQNISVQLGIVLDGKVVDEFISDGIKSKDAGNCAFVQHGNQGLTYTDVFYGNPNGISGIDGSGYDEVLQAHEATGVPGNFHMSGTLIPAAEWHNPEFNDWLATMAGNGLAAMMTSALGQNIMPFAYNEMNDWSVYVESQMVNYQYNYTPHVAWVPERVWLGQGYYPDAGVIDWLGDNWEQHGVWGVVLDDTPHLNGYDNRKIHWMNNGSGVSLRVIPINNSFVGNVMYDTTAAKNQIASMGQYNICVYGTDWEVSAEMNEHDGTAFLDNYENILWYCHDNYPGVNVWKLDDAIQNPDFNGTSASLTKGTYNLLGGTDGYGGSNNSWYINWAATPSHSDNHSPQWNYGSVWTDAYNFLMSVNDNNLAQLAWYTMMINLHETGWHTSGEVADWEHRYSSHIKNSNVYTEASRWADGQYSATTACYFSDIDHDGGDELVMHNDKVFMVFEGIGGKANWVFYKNGLGDTYSVVSSDMAYWSETDGDYNENSSNNHVAALSDVSPNQQDAIYNITIDQSAGDTVQATLDQWGVQKTLTLFTGVDYLDIVYDFYNQTGYVKSGWSPDLLDILWSGKSNLQRMWGDYGSYCGYRNSASGATAAIVLGNGGGSQNTEFEGTLVKGDEIHGYNKFKIRLFAGYTSEPYGTSVPELDVLAADNLEVFPPELYSPAVITAINEILLTFNEAVDQSTSENISNYSLQNFSGSYTIINAARQADWRKIKLTIAENLQVSDAGQIVVSNIEDLNGNIIGNQNIATLTVPTGITPHTIVADDGINEFIDESELIETQSHDLWITWDDDNLYIGFYSMDLNLEGDFFVNIDTDQTSGSGATTGSWERVNFAGIYLPDYQVAIKGGFNPIELNNWAGSGWNYPGAGGVTSYNGWSGNGLTEVSIPWSSIGYPANIALSVHITEEESDMVPEAFPGLNPIGSNPTITHFYAFFQPFISGDMPLSGIEPNSVFVVPNTSSVITNHNPLDLNVTMLVNTSQSFSVSMTDAENDSIVYDWGLDGNPVSSLSSYLYSPGLSDIGNHILRIVAGDEVPGNEKDTVTWNINVIESAITLNLKIFLEGPFNGNSMEPDLNNSGIIPLWQPYSTYPWYYGGGESVVAVPGINVTDWILIELRDAADAGSATSSTTIERQAAFVTSNGVVIGIGGSEDLQFKVAVNQQLFVVIYHRDHISVMSANALVETDGVYSYDFSTSADQVYGGADGYKEIAPDIWGMVGGDANNDGVVNDLDKNNYWKVAAGSYGYIASDFDMSSQVDNADKNDIWLPNSGMGVKKGNKVFKCQIPE